MSIKFPAVKLPRPVAVVVQHRAAICHKFVRDLEHYGLFMLTTLDSPHFVMLAAGGFAVYALLVTTVVVYHLET